MAVFQKNAGAFLCMAVSVEHDDVLNSSDEHVDFSFATQMCSGEDEVLETLICQMEFNLVVEHLAQGRG